MLWKSVEILQLANGKLPSIPFQKIAREILGLRYELSLVICGDTLAKKINRQYRKKSYAANVLSFPLGKSEGEIFLNMQAARRETKLYDVTLRARLTLLFIHACFHLKGLKHGKRMGKLEKRMLVRFS